MNFAENFEEVLSAFNKHFVDYMVVGGYAVNFHGYERTTSDLDLWVKSTNDNMQKIYSAIIEMKFPAVAAVQILKFDLSKPFLFHIGEKPNDVEVFNHINNVTYEEAELHKIVFNENENLQVWFISLRDLIVNKMTTGRLQDAADVDILQKINQHKT